MDTKETVFVIIIASLYLLALYVGLPWLVATVGTGIADLLFNMENQDTQTLFKVLFALTILLRFFKPKVVKSTKQS